MATTEDLVELYRACATTLPADVLAALKAAVESESSERGKAVLKAILDNAAMARREERPMCQDTGVPLFYIDRPAGEDEQELRDAIAEATRIATHRVPLRPNAVEPLSGKPLGNAPILHSSPAKRQRIRLLLKGAGSENLARVYSLPDDRIGAERDIEGVRRCVLDAIVRAQGKGCPPYIVGVAVAATLEEAAGLATRQLLRPLDEKPGEHAELERGLLAGINRLGIGPMGLGGSVTALGVKAAFAPRHPATFFVGVAFGCWAMRRGEL